MIPCLGVAGFLAGSSYFLLEAWLNHHWVDHHFPYQRGLADALIFGAFAAICCAGVGGTIALIDDWILRLAIAPAISWAGLAAIGFIMEGDSESLREWLTSKGLALALPTALVLTVLHGVLLKRHDRGTLGLAGPYGAVIVGGVMGPVISRLLGDDTFKAAIATGVLACLTQYYALMVALAIHRRRSASHGAEPRSPSSVEPPA